MDRAIRFYELHLGLDVLHRAGSDVWLGVPGATRAGALLILKGSLDAPHVTGTTGLYHFAILVPTRADLGRVLRRLVGTGARLQGAADHGVSEAIYLADPDGNGIEIYRDRPRAEWPTVDGRLHMSVDPLDLDALLDEVNSVNRVDRVNLASSGLPTGTIMGHVHLRVSDIAAARRFYVDVLGFALMLRYGPSALFVSAGGYHHHIGLNTWAGIGAPPPPPGAIGLRHFTVRLPDVPALEDVVSRLGRAGIPVETIGEARLAKDPSSNAILLATRDL